MYRRMIVPVDLAHVERRRKALDTATDLAKHFGSSICFVGVTTGTPGQVAHTPEEYTAKLSSFAAQQSKAHGLKFDAKVVTSHDPAADLDERLIDAARDTGSDLVVMASHIPGFPEHLFASNAGAEASHAGVSVFVVR